MSEFWSRLNAAERKAIRDEMLRMTMDGIKQSNPKMSKGAACVKASKFVEAAIQKEIRSNGKTDSSNAQVDSIQ